MAKASRGGRGRGKSNTLTDRILATRSHGALRNLLAKRGITMDASLDSLPLRAIRPTIAGAAFILEDIGILGELKTIKAGDTAEGFASAEVGTLTLDEKWYGGDWRTMAATMKNVAYVRGFNKFSLGAHEGAHLAEAWLSGDDADVFMSGDNAERVMAQAYQYSTEARSARGEAVESRDDMVARISGNAQKSTAESLAEAIADSVANGPAAEDISTAARRALKEIVRAEKKGRR